MTPSKTPFAGYERLAPGDPLSSDGYYFQSINPLLADRLGRLGAVTHRHDAHAALVDPTLAPTVSSASSGGAIPAATAISVVYTLLDADGGETLPVAPVGVSTSAGYLDPTSPPATAVSYAAGTLLAGTFSYAATITDGLGGETVLGPSALAVIDPGHAHGEVTISGLTAIANAASGSDPAAGWRLWRSQGGGPWYLIASGAAATDTFLDNGVAGNCTLAPPTVGTTGGANTLTVSVPGGQPAAAVSFNVYASIDGSFTSPALLGNYPTAVGATVITYTALLPDDGSPPTVSRCYPGADQIDPSTDILNWTWKQTVANFAALPSVGNIDGDVRVTLDTHTEYVWNGSAWVLPGLAIFAQLTATQTLTNKRISRRVVTVTQSATPAVNTDITDVASITGLAQAITSMTTNLTGTPVDGDELTVRLTDDGTARAITWGAKFEASTVALPTTTVVSTLLVVRFIWNTATSKWRCVLVA